MNLLPINATKSEIALESTTQRLTNIPVPIDRLWNPATCDLFLLPWLAWALSVDYWNPSWSEKIKRQVLAAAFYVHQVKGTVAALETALIALDLDGVDLPEWFDFDGEPYTFRVDVELLTRGLSDGEAVEIAKVIKRAKNVRSHLDRLRIFLTGRAAGIPQMSMAMCCGETITIEPHAITEVEASGAVPVWLAAHYGVETVTINPQEET